MQMSQLTKVLAKAQELVAKRKATLQHALAKRPKGSAAPPDSAEAKGAEGSAAAPERTQAKQLASERVLRWFRKPWPQ